MNVLCSDKTGTITEGKIGIRASVDARGNHSEKTLLYAYLNAVHETGFINPIDEALRANPPANCDGWQKLDELPYDFARKRLSILCENKDGACSGYEGCVAAGFGDLFGSRIPADGRCDRHRQDRSRTEIDRTMARGLVPRRKPGSSLSLTAGAEVIVYESTSRKLKPKMVFPRTPSRFPILRKTGSGNRLCANYAISVIRLKIVTGDNASSPTHCARSWFEKRTQSSRVPKCNA